MADAKLENAVVFAEQSPDTGHLDYQNYIYAWERLNLVKAKRKGK